MFLAMTDTTDPHNPDPSVRPRDPSTVVDYSYPIELYDGDAPTHLPRMPAKPGTLRYDVLVELTRTRDAVAATNAGGWLSVQEISDRVNHRKISVSHHVMFLYRAKMPGDGGLVARRRVKLAGKRGQPPHLYRLRDDVVEQRIVAAPPGYKPGDVLPTTARFGRGRADGEHHRIVPGTLGAVGPLAVRPGPVHLLDPAYVRPTVLGPAALEGELRQQAIQTACGRPAVDVQWGSLEDATCAACHAVLLPGAAGLLSVPTEPLPFSDDETDALEEALLAGLSQPVDPNRPAPEGLTVWTELPQPPVTPLQVHEDGTIDGYLELSPLGHEVAAAQQERIAVVGTGLVSPQLTDEQRAALAAADPGISIQPPALELEDTGPYPLLADCDASCAASFSHGDHWCRPPDEVALTGVVDPPVCGECGGNPEALCHHCRPVETAEAMWNHDQDASQLSADDLTLLALHHPDIAVREVCGEVLDTTTTTTATCPTCGAETTLEVDDNGSVERCAACGFVAARLNEGQLDLGIVSEEWKLPYDPQCPVLTTAPARLPDGTEIVVEHEDGVTGLVPVTQLYLDGDTITASELGDFAGRLVQRTDGSVAGYVREATEENRTRWLGYLSIIAGDDKAEKILCGVPSVEAVENWPHADGCTGEAAAYTHDVRDTTETWTCQACGRLVARRATRIDPYDPPPVDLVQVAAAEGPACPVCHHIWGGQNCTHGPRPDDPYLDPEAAREAGLPASYAEERLELLSTVGEAMQGGLITGMRSGKSALVQAIEEAEARGELPPTRMDVPPEIVEQAEEIVVEEVASQTTQLLADRLAAVDGGAAELVSATTRPVEELPAVTIPALAPPPKVVHCKVAAEGTFEYIGRPSIYGNPIALTDPTDDKARAENIEEFRRYFDHRIATDDSYRDAVEDLRGKDLGCWCKTQTQPDRPCHGDVYMEWLY